MVNGHGQLSIALLPILQSSFFAEPRDQSGRNPNDAFGIIWPHNHSMQEHKLHTTDHAIGFFRFQNRCGIRLPSPHLEKAHGLLKPQEPFVSVKVTNIYRAYPLPHGTQRSGLRASCMGVAGKTSPTLQGRQRRPAGRLAPTPTLLGTLSLLTPATFSSPVSKPSSRPSTTNHLLFLTERKDSFVIATLDNQPATTLGRTAKTHGQLGGLPPRQAQPRHRRLTRCSNSRLASKPTCRRPYARKSLDSKTPRITTWTRCLVFATIAAAQRGRHPRPFC